MMHDDNRQEDLDEERSDSRRTMIAAGVIGVVALGLAVGIYFAVNNGSVAKKRVQEPVLVQLVKPPPPPPPPKVEKPPEPTKLQEAQEKINQVKPMDAPKDAPPPPGPLALGEKGGPGSDAFGLGGNPGGTDIFGNGAGGAGSPYAWYNQLVSSELSDSLHRVDKLQGHHYHMRVQLSLSSLGKVLKVHVTTPTADREIDDVIRQVLAEFQATKPPPQGMGQPMRIEINSQASS